MVGNSSSLARALRYFPKKVRDFGSRRQRSKQLARFKRRWIAYSSFPAAEEAIPNPTREIYDRVQVRVINLDSRMDRLDQIGSNLRSMGFHQWDRISGFNGRERLPSFPGLLSGSIGCEISHIAAISNGFGKNVEAIIVCEDDLEFLCQVTELKHVIEEFLADPRIDILALSGRPRGGSIVISENLRIVFGLVGRGCYLLKPHMVAPLLEIFSEGLRKLLAGDLRGKGDLMWRQAQLENYVFAFPRQHLAQQSAGFSDIESKELGPR